MNTVYRGMYNILPYAERELRKFICKGITSDAVGRLENYLTITYLEQNKPKKVVLLP